MGHIDQSGYQLSHLFTRISNTSPLINTLEKESESDSETCIIGDIKHEPGEHGDQRENVLVGRKHSQSGIENSLGGELDERVFQHHSQDQRVAPHEETEIELMPKTSIGEDDHQIHNIVFTSSQRNEDVPSQ